MLKNLLLLVLFSLNLFAAQKADKTDLNFLRVNFYSAVENEDITLKIENYIHSKFSTDEKNYPPVILAYYAGVEALRAKHAFNPYTKVKYLVNSLNNLSDAVAKEPASMEIRFIRFSILHHLPGILGYGKEKEDDLEFLYNALHEKNYNELDSSIQKGIVEFVINSKRLAPEKQTSMEKFYSSVYK